jgi:hypothetical protein
MPRGRIVEIDRALHKAKSKGIAIEGHVPLRLTGNRGDVVDANALAHDLVPEMRSRWT